MRIVGSRKRQMVLASVRQVHKRPAGSFQYPVAIIRRLRSQGRAGLGFVGWLAGQGAALDQFGPAEDHEHGKGITAGGAGLVATRGAGHFIGHFLDAPVQ